VWDKGLSLVGEKLGNTLLIMTLITQLREKINFVSNKNNGLFCDIFQCLLVPPPVFLFACHKKYRQLIVKSFLIF
jgi:hypothetical protein